MTARRMKSSVPVRSREREDLRCSKSGSTRSLQTMVLTAMASTITMPVAADKPPTKAASASTGMPAASGRLSTKVSAFARPAKAGPWPDSEPKKSRPPSAIGSTKRLISSR